MTSTELRRPVYGAGAGGRIRDFSSIKSAFEGSSKTVSRGEEWRATATSTSSSSSSGSGGSRKVTEMATLFQRSGGQTADSSPRRRDRSLERDAPLVRSESHLARFHSARAMFESMAERPVERRQSAKERSRPTSLCGGRDRTANGGCKERERASDGLSPDSETDGVALLRDPLTKSGCGAGGR
ncbi:uncharacterized protein LOC119089968 [Pollicipes pollicipes]|uniref:uncharacterized protein LOC119089968 n=1 Tax=Pollicipes pollicipes TaxID=41117 RepID=UPI001884D01C|nr:uncharacterized protein LOC119089968 [Pollicipes pollicipes]